jgi:hypothetical protein
LRGARIGLTFGGTAMLDLFYVGVVLFFLWGCRALVKAFDRL